MGNILIKDIYNLKQLEIYSMSIKNVHIAPPYVKTVAPRDEVHR